MDTNANKLCMIPGPVEFHPSVLSAMSVKSTSHVDPNFIQLFGKCLSLLKQIFFAEKSYPFILSGSGVLGWDIVAANLLQLNDEVLVLSTGVFGDRFADCFKTYGSKVTKLDAPLGSNHPLKDIETILQTQSFKLVTITQVDTSTGVLSDVKSISKLIKQYQPDAFIVVDGVCSAAAEELRFDEFGIDVMMTASQKAIGVPPGLALLVISERAMEFVNNRKSPIPNYYANLTRWLPIMQAYGVGKPSYFATPSVQLINALYVGLNHLIEYGLDNSFKKHQEVSQQFRNQVAKLNLKTVTLSEEVAAHTMTTVYYPDNIDGSKLLAEMSKNNVTIAGGLHPQMATKYFRIGHMGYSALTPEVNHITQCLDALEKSLKTLGHKF